MSLLHKKAYASSLFGNVTCQSCSEISNNPMIRSPRKNSLANCSESEFLIETLKYGNWEVFFVEKKRNSVRKLYDYGIRLPSYADQAPPFVVGPHIFCFLVIPMTRVTLTLITAKIIIVLLLAVPLY